LTLGARLQKLGTMKEKVGSSRDGDALQRAMAAIQNRRPEEAEGIADRLLSGNPRHSSALHVRGLALLAQGRAREAVAPLEQAAQLRADPVIETHLAIALRQTDRRVQAIEVLERATARQPAFAPAFHELGVILFSLRRLDEAQAVLERGIALAPAVPELSIVLGGVLLDRADRASAKRAFARALVNAPGHPGALYGLGSVLMADGEFIAAAERFRQALARDPGYAQARLSLGGCLLELGRWDEALACLRALVNSAPQMYAQALRTLVSTGRGRFWLKPSEAAAMLGS
jgi:tetratricopeptide (TPR) repeat protein